MNDKRMLEYFIEFSKSSKGFGDFKFFIYCDPWCTILSKLSAANSNQWLGVW